MFAHIHMFAQTEMQLDIALCKHKRNTNLCDSTAHKVGIKTCRNMFQLCMYINVAIPSCKCVFANDGSSVIAT